MEFHLDPAVLEIAQLHIDQVVKLEESEAKRLLKRYREVRQELRDRLDTLPRDKFSAQQLRGVLLQVDLAIQAMNDRLKTGMADSSQVLAEAGVEHLASELDQYNAHFLGAVVPINLNAVVAGTDTSNFLINNYETSLDAYSSAIRSNLTSTITNAIIEQVSLSEVVHRMGQFFVGEEWKLQQIARTELHNVYNIGKMRTMSGLAENQIPDLKKTLMHPMDSRTGDDSKKAARLDLIVPVDEPFVYTWNGDERRFMAPPDRPNDRAILVPYRDSWSER